MGQSDEKEKGHLARNDTEENQKRDNFVQMNGR